ncbi:ubiquitin fusion degradation protein [Naganishia albida]|nr:ubiquitin fusion degradation protein [Naganishia albida]
MYRGNWQDEDDDEDDQNLPFLPGGTGGNRGASGSHPSSGRSTPGVGAGPGGFGGYRQGATGIGARGGPGGFGGGLLGQLMNGGGFGGGMGMGFGMNRGPADPGAFNEYFKAYSVAVMNGRERPELAYGGKVIMPPSALASLTSLDIEGPWTFNLKNPKNPSALSTHAGVLEFIGEEGCCYLPAWMMKQLNLTEGDPVSVRGAKLPKGKMVKLQAQTVDFLEVADPKAALEQALRYFSVLTRGDIIEVSFSMLTFEFLIMEITPDGPGINIIDTDLEVDFAAPKGYVEPTPAAPVPIATMADKLKIDINSLSSAVSTRPSSAASSRTGAAAAASETGGYESFKGSGATLNGRRTKGKGLAKQIQEVDKDSKITRTDKARIVTNESIANDGRMVPAALDLPPGKLFFGFTYKPYDPKAATVKKVEPEDGAGASARPSFVGAGTTLSGRNPRPSANNPAATSTDLPKVKEEEKDDPWAKLGSGAKLTSNSSKTPAATTVEPRQGASNTRSQAIVVDDDDLMHDSSSEFNGFDEDEDIIEIDSD